MEFILSFLNLLPLWLYLLIAVFSLYYLYNTRDFNYWKKQGVPGAKPYFLIGTLWDFWKTKLHIAILNSFKQYGPVYGTFEWSSPVLVVADPDLLKLIMVKDFHVFPNRKLEPIFSKDKLMNKMLSLMRGEEWKITRSTLTPAYTTGKLKQMVQLVEECGQNLIRSLEVNADNGEAVDFAKIFPNLTLDIIASTAFGVKVDCVKNPNSEFAIQVQKCFQPNPTALFIVLLLSPILKWVLFKIPSPLNYFANIANETIDIKTKNQENKRKDFLQIMLEAEIPNEEFTRLSNESKELSLSSKRTLTRDVIVSQIVLFIIAGHETTANTLKLMAYELAINQDIQEKLIKEVDEIMSECKEKLSYDNIASMQYMDMVVSETLRKYPPALFTDRECSEDGYNLNGITLRKGMSINIHIYAIHHNPKYYPEPNLFDPDRFLPENKATRDPLAYIPFGAGPRSCVAMRFALMEVKLIMTQMLFSFRFQTCQETEFPLKFEFGAGFLRPATVLLKLQKRIDQPHFD